MLALDSLSRGATPKLMPQLYGEEQAISIELPMAEKMPASLDTHWLTALSEAPWLIRQ